MHGANLVPEFQPHGVHLVELVRQRSLSLLAGALILAACVSCGDATDTRPVTREEAEHALADVVAIARSGNFDALCSYQGVNQAMCERQLEFAGVPAPSTAPAVAASRELRADPHPGLVLRLCGTKDSGEQYVSDLAVWRVDGKIEVQNPVYWSGTLIQELLPGETAVAQRHPVTECD